jgi:predicted ATPase
MKTDTRHPFGELLAQYRARKPGLTQTHLAELAGYNQAILVRMAQGKKDLTGPSGRERMVRLIETLADQSALTTLDEANALLLSADMPPLFERNLNEAHLITRLSRLPVGQRVRRTNLPAPLTSFVGRGQEIAEVRRLLGLTRLLTLTGAGGCGKTRLAQRIAADVLITYSEGVWYAELAALSDPALIPDVVARALGLIAVDRPAQEQVLDFLRERHTLLVLDNCEHLIDAVVAFSIEVLRACPRVTILTTSRERLDIEGEATWRVPPMQPDEAGQLFVERGRLSRTELVLNVTDPQITNICQQLDGMPLAIELAAARLHELNLSDVAARLDDRFTLLTSGRRGGLPRHQTLRGLIDWSYDSLSEPEKIVFRRLGVFVGGFALAQAEEVLRDEPFAQSSTVTTPIVHQVDILTLLTKLVSKSLITVDGYAGGTRYRLLETVREYALGRLTDYSELEDVRRRHAKAFYALGLLHIPHKNESAYQTWMTHLEEDVANLRSAIEWHVQFEPTCAFQFCFALDEFWQSKGYFSDARHLLQQLLAKNIAPPQMRAKALFMAGHFAHLQSDYADARVQLEASQQIFSGINDTDGISDVLSEMGWLARATNELTRSINLFERSLSLRRMNGDKRSIAHALVNLGCVLGEAGCNYESAKTCLEESETLFCEIDDGAGHANALYRQGALEEINGDVHAANCLMTEALSHYRKLGMKRETALAAMGVGYFTRLKGDCVLALSYTKESLMLFEEIGARRDTAFALLRLAQIYRCLEATHQSLVSGQNSLKINFELGDKLMIGFCMTEQSALVLSLKKFKHSAKLLGTAQAQLDVLLMPYYKYEPYSYTNLALLARAALGDEAYEAAYAEGRAMTLEQAISYALQIT